MGSSAAPTPTKTGFTPHPAPTAASLVTLNGTANYTYIDLYGQVAYNGTWVEHISCVTIFAELPGYQDDAFRTNNLGDSAAMSFSRGLRSYPRADGPADISGFALTLEVYETQQVGVSLNGVEVAIVSPQNLSGTTAPLPSATGAWAIETKFCRWELKMAFGNTPQVNKVVLTLQKDPSASIFDAFDWSVTGGM